MKLLLCCGVSKPYLNYDSINKKFFVSKKKEANCFNGKVIASAECNKTELFQIEYYPPNSKGADCYQDLRLIHPSYDDDYDMWDYDIIYSNDQDKENPIATKLFKNGMKSFEELGEFATKGKYNPSFINEFYGLYLSNLNIFNNAMDVTAYDKGYFVNKFTKHYPCRGFENLGVVNIPLEFVPKNMIYCFDEICKKFLNETMIMMTVNAVDLCEILNGNKTIEFRKRVLKPLKDLAFN